jgi:hypothetical protein
MQLKVLMSVIVGGILIGIGVLAGSVMGSSGAAAQTPNATPTTTPKSETNPGSPANPGKGWPGDMGGKRGDFGPGGRGGHDGFGPEGFGPGGATADGATRQISNTISLITLVKGDLAYAAGKMDTTDVQRWVSGADALLKSAQSANSSSNYGQAVGYARAASELASVAESQMAQKLGADKLPSYSQRPQRPNRPADPNGTTATITQAQASRVLQSTYNRLVAQGALLKSAANPGDAATYLTDAQNAYKAAYASYQAGSYSDAVASAKLAGRLAEVSDAILQATSAPNDSNTPVTVPAPNFQ